MEGITDSMKQYERAMDEVIKKNPKNGKEYGVKRPDSANIVVVVAGLFALIVILVEVMR